MKNSHPETLEAVYYWEKAKYAWNSLRLEEFLKTSMPSPVESFEYIKCYSSSGTSPIKNPSNTTKYNCQKICSWTRTPTTILEIRKETPHYEVIKFTSFHKMCKSQKEYHGDYSNLNLTQFSPSHPDPGRI